MPSTQPYHIRRSIALPVFNTLLLLFTATTLCYSFGRDSSGVAKAFQRLHAAMLAPDANTLNSITHPLLSYGHSSGVMDNQQQFTEKLVSGKSVFKSLHTEDVVYTHSGKVVLVRYRLKAETNDSGTPGQIDLKVLLVFQRYRQGWLLLGRQAVKVPVTN